MLLPKLVMLTLTIASSLLYAHQAGNAQQAASQPRAPQTAAPPAAAPGGQGQPADGGPFTGNGPGGAARQDPGVNLMSNPYRMTENWPMLNPGMKWGAAINFLPDKQGRDVGASPNRAADRVLRRVWQDRAELRARACSLRSRDVPRPRRQHLGGRQRRSPATRPRGADSRCSSSAPRARCC